MHKKYFISFVLAFLLLIFSCSYSFAAIENSNTKNAVMDAGNSIGQAAVSTKNAIVSGMQDIGNGIETMGNDAMNTIGTTGNDMSNTMWTAESDYTATRTATANNNLLGLSDTAWTWLILGIVGAAIVGLVWYYGSQYERRNYDHD